MVGEVLKTKKQTTQSKKKMAKELNREFSKEEIQIIINIFKKCSTPSAIRQMQIKTILRVYLMPIRMVIIKKTNVKKCWQECGDRWTVTVCRSVNQGSRYGNQCGRFSGSYPVTQLSHFSAYTQETPAQSCTLLLSSQIARKWDRPGWPSADERIWNVVRIHDGILFSYEKYETFRRRGEQCNSDPERQVTHSVSNTWCRSSLESSDLCV